MRAIAPIILALTFLFGCTSVNTGNVDDAIKANLPKVCLLISSAHAAFLQIDAVHPLSASIVKKEALAWSASGPVCADPTHVTVANALPIAIQIYGITAEALIEAKRSGA